ncbi:unnamed protein product [Parnassius mnemosyne]|uniref:RRM domain-containing protein n=1 Tax=Parnassius mnemosyne TaxID=213953 RepID=A0AAV1L9E9_9NEOP
MANRTWNNHNQDWDPMRDDYNDSVFEPQYPDDNAGGGVNLDHCRLYITNIPKTLNEEGLRTAFAKYGTLTEAFLSKDTQKRYGLISYETPGEAKLAMMKLNRTEPLKLNVNIAHKERRRDTQERRKDTQERDYNQHSRDDSVSVVSRGRNSQKQEDTLNGEGEMEDLVIDDDLGLTDSLDPELHKELVQLRIEQLKLKEEQLQCRQRMIILNQAGKKPIAQGSSNRCILPDGRIVVKNINDRVSEAPETDGFGIGSGDSNGKHCTCSKSWDRSGSSGDDSSSASTCVLCREGSRINRTWEVQDKSDLESNITESRAATKTVDLTSKESKGLTSLDKKSDFTSGSERKECDRESETLYDFKFSDFVSEEGHDETNRLIQLRNTDYLDIVEEHLKIVVALSGYPKSKMRLKHMEQLQRSLTDIIDMQIKAGLLKTVPSFLDYYLNRGAIVFICKDLGTRDWIVRVSDGLEERMNKGLILLNSKVKRICLAMLKIPQSCWPDTALDVFKLLQYFNPTLKTDKWKIYAQKIIDDVECTSFLIDRVSGEIIRGPTFKNVIDYCNMEFELTGYTEIYYESFDLKDDLSSVASRVKLLKEIKSEEVTPRNDSKTNLKTNKEINIIKNKIINALTETKELKNVLDNKKDLENPVQIDTIKKLTDVDYVNEKNETIDLSVKTTDDTSDKENEDAHYDNDQSTSTTTFREKTGSLTASSEDFVEINRTITIDSNRGIAYYRRTNYLHMDNDLKIAITLDGYPQNKLEGTHIRSLKRLFKEHLHKDIKRRRFNNLIIPKFQDVYLSNGAVVYICDSLETKEYLTEILPKFITATRLKLVFKDISELLRYTRVVMRLPKELAHFESKEILSELNAKYPGLKLNNWKFYSDVAGKQKREFGVDPESLDIIKSSTFNFSYKGEAISFRIIDRKGKNVTCSETETKLVDVEDFEAKALWEKICREMYCPINPDIMSTPLTRVRTKHYSNLIADDLKLYVGPSNYPETRVDDDLFFTFKNAMTSVVMDSVRNDKIAIPKIHDMYLFDGVIFVICKDIISKKSIQDHIPAVNSKLHMNFKSTEFRGAVGIVRMVVNTDKDTDEVISILQKQNPRLRTKYWRKISVVRSESKLDVVLQIDRLSAQVITSPDFNEYIDSSAVQFKLGHLQSLIKPKSSLEYLERKYNDTQNNKQLHTLTENSTIDTEIGQGISEKEISHHTTKSKNIILNVKTETEKLDLNCDECPDRDLESHKSVINMMLSSEKNNESYYRMILKIPTNILPEDKDDFNIILDLLEDKNPGLNTELWKISYDPDYPNKGKFTILIDKQSASVIKSKAFDSTIGGEKLKFFF